MPSEIKESDQALNDDINAWLAEGVALHHRVTKKMKQLEKETLQTAELANVLAEAQGRIEKMLSVRSYNSELKT